MRLVTSQNVTAPKLFRNINQRYECLVTSQNVTAPKPFLFTLPLLFGLVTSQNVTAPKPVGSVIETTSLFSYQSECHCAKTKMQH